MSVPNMLTKTKNKAMINEIAEIYKVLGYLIFIEWKDSGTNSLNC